MKDEQTTPDETVKPEQLIAGSQDYSLAATEAVPSSPVVTPSVEKLTETTQTVPTPSSQNLLLPEPPNTADIPEKSTVLRKILLGFIGIALTCGLVLEAYAIGKSHGVATGKKQATTSATAKVFKVPTAATMIAQCTEGEGTQYVLPGDIPGGPIYNIWKGKVTGIEYMLGQSQILNSKTLDLALMDQKYNHVDVMYEAAGHAGFTEPHYHTVFSFISYADEQKITCTNTSSDSMNMNMEM